MPIYSDSDDHAAGTSQATRFWHGPDRPLDYIIGRGKVADVLLWRNKNLSASILAGFTLIWFLFEVVELRFITIACYILMGSMVILFAWIQASNYFNWRPPTIYDIQVSESTARHIHSRVNKWLIKLYKLSCGQDMVRFCVVCDNVYPSHLLIVLPPDILLCAFLNTFQALALLWVLSIFGSYSSTLNVVYIVFLCLILIPVMYERYEREVNYIATRGKDDIKRLYRKMDTKFISKIPRGPVKQRKFK